MSETIPAPTGDAEQQLPSIASRFTLLVNSSITVDELRRAAESIGAHLYATPNGWVMDHVHIFHLVKKDGA